jgi:hypothetical protein
MLLALLGSSRAIADDLYAVHSDIAPKVVRLGERATYHGWVIVPHGEAVNFITPRTSGAFSFGTAVTRRSSAGGGPDTVRLDVPIQTFALGAVSVPGARFRIPYLPGSSTPSEHALPVALVEVVPQIAVNDTAADLRPLRGPLAAPWWERVNWTLVGIVLAVIAAVIALIRFARRRRPAPAPAAPVKAVARRDPSAEALAALASLRRLRLPDQDRFGEHAFHLTRIVRRYLEATAGGVRPGLTSSELVALLGSGASRVDVPRLDALLRLWDGIKFARNATTADEARHAEDAVESLVRPAPIEASEVA